MLQETLNLNLSVLTVFCFWRGGGAVFVSCIKIVLIHCLQLGLLYCFGGCFVYCFKVV